MKKIAIITVCDALNFGTHLQIYALNQILIQRYQADVKVITNSHPPLKERFIFARCRNPIKLLRKIRTMFKLNTFYKKLKMGDINFHYDVAIVGSDELWNTKNEKLVHDGLFVCKNVDAEVYATYAVSCNGVTHDEFEEIYGNNPLNQFDYISVRDTSTELLVRSFQRECLKQLDPTFLLDFSPIINSKRRDILLVYGYWFTDEEINDICSFASRKNVKTVSIGMDCKWCDEYVVCDPIEFVEYIESAAYFVTSTFHGCAIAIQRNTNFVAYIRDNQKVFDLLDEFKLLNRDVSKHTLEKTFEEEIDFSSINHEIMEKKQQGFVYLDMVMERGRIKRNEG
ncbi:MAG: polysaccharide pyruvyl transferase family protein [Lachnospiraceae bacterium]|nr:polysaccharide pyruvyl transferase family protein [Lachnospiraceae bacterium]